MDDVLTVASRFRGGPNATALACPEVSVDGAAILCIVRKNNVWQFLCGRDHSAEYVTSYSDPVVTTVKEIVARDPSVAPVATMNDHHIAERESPSEPWVPRDDLSLWWWP